MKINVYIITEEGRAYKTKGLNYVKNLLIENFKINPNDEITYNQGAIYNNREHLLKSLDDDKTNNIPSYLAISTAEEIAALPVAENTKDFIRETEGTTWEIFNQLIEEHKN